MIIKESWLKLRDFYELKLTEEQSNLNRPDWIKYFIFRIESCNREIKSIIDRELDG